MRVLAGHWGVVEMVRCRSMETTRSGGRVKGHVAEGEFLLVRHRRDGPMKKTCPFAHF